MEKKQIFSQYNPKKIVLENGFILGKKTKLATY